MDNNKPKTLSWDDFILQGNPDAVIEETPSVKMISFKSKLKVHYEKKEEVVKKLLLSEVLRKMSNMIWIQFVKPLSQK